MARTKQTARIPTGGKAPKRARGLYTNEKLIAALETEDEKVVLETINGRVSKWGLDALLDFAIKTNSATIAKKTLRSTNFKTTFEKLQRLVAKIPADTELLELILLAYPKIKLDLKNREDLLVVAAGNGYERLVQYLLDAGTKVDPLAVRIAKYHNYKSIVKLLQ